MIMNRKIFTLLASALMLLTAVFQGNAKIGYGSAAIGDSVGTLPGGVGKGMYHIRVDSIYHHGLGRYVAVSGAAAASESDPYFGLGSIDDPGATTPGYGNATDTVVLAVNEAGKVVAVSISAIRRQAIGTSKGITYADIQSTLWCIQIDQPEDYGYWPTYHFTNKLYGHSLDIAEGEEYVNTSGTGWMFSQSYNTTPLKTKQPLYGYSPSGNGYYNVLMDDTLENGTTYPGTSYVTKKYEIDCKKVYHQDFVGDTAIALIDYFSDYRNGAAGTGKKDEKVYDYGMLKFTIVEAAPIVLDAAAFNTQLGTTDGTEPVSLIFEPDATAGNAFKTPLKAIDYTEAGGIVPGYITVAENGNFTSGVIFNSLHEYGDVPLYTNDLGMNYVKIYKGTPRNLPSGGWQSGLDPYDPTTNVRQPVYDNSAYRFVYFPSSDSLVINALRVRHYQNGGSFTDGVYGDATALAQLASPTTGSALYTTPAATGLDAPGALTLGYQNGSGYWGLYNSHIHEALYVRWQDLYGVGESIVTIDEFPPNIHIKFGLTGCEAAPLDYFDIASGVYTIWDSRGWFLGVRVYNGTLVPTWIEPLEGECVDRIPSYQWVVERQQGSGPRVNIINREFGKLEAYNNVIFDLFGWKNILIRKGSTQIFQASSNFNFTGLYDLAQMDGDELPNYGYVNGAYVPVESTTGCKLTEVSGFRPVNDSWVSDKYLGYKHFVVGNDPLLVNYGKSDALMVEEGMDWNAFCFNYLHRYANHPDRDEEYYYIDQKALNGEQILAVNPNENEKEAFQFMLGTQLRYDYKEELFGYPEPGRGNYKDYELPIVVDDEGGYVQHAAQLERYFYELKVADYYSYRDGLAEQYVVLKGAAPGDAPDALNAMKYGLADVWADYDPLKFSNVYLRETYFLKRDYKTAPDGTIVEERDPKDESRRIYYAIMDRIEPAQFDRLKAMGLEVMDTLKYSDESVFHSYVIWGVDDANGYIKAQGKTVSSVRPSTFALENYYYQLYRRLCSIEDDFEEGVTDYALDQDDSQETYYDQPKYLKVYTDNNKAEYLYEDALSAYSYGFGPNYLGLNNRYTYPEEVKSPDGTYKYNYTLFFDTAFINRGTGPIKPQYLIAVDVQFPDPALIGKTFTHEVPNEDPLCPPSYVTTVFKPYIKGRYLVNATDSARNVGSNGTYGASKEKRPGGDKYIWDTSWDRLIFVDAVHADDRLYILSQINAPASAYTAKATLEDGSEIEFIDVDALRSLTVGQAREPMFSGKLGAYYDFGVWDDYHNDVTFSLRFIPELRANLDKTEYKPVYNADWQTGGQTIKGSTNKEKRFLIESETTNRTPYGNRRIAPVQGGWIRIKDGVPVLSRSSYEDAIQLAEIFNVQNTNLIYDDTERNPLTGNKTIAVNPVKVIAGDGSISVLNAGGKKVTVTNLLGQKVADTVLGSDNATVKAPKGIVIVSVEGEKAVKSIVK
jgi:hypothetical protein